MKEAEISKPNGTPKGPPTVVDPTPAKSEPAIDERMQAMLRGDVSPPNEFAAYFVQKLRTTMLRGEQASGRLEQARQLMRSLEVECYRLEGAANEYAADLKKWGTVDSLAVPKDGTAQEDSNDV